MRSEGTMWKRDGIWQTRRAIKGRRLQWSTKTGEKELARARARDHWAAVVAENFALVDRQRSKSGAPTFAELRAAYLAWEPASGKPSRATRRANFGCLERVVELGEGTMRPDDRVSRLGAEVVRAFQAARLKAAGEDREVRARVMFSCNSQLTQARAVFRHAEPWAAAGLVVPDLVEFRRAPRFVGVAIESEFRPFAPAEQAALLAALALARTAAPGLWIAAALMLFGGLRNSEVRRARRSWMRAGAIFVAVSKSIKGVRTVPLPAEIAAGVLELAGPDELVPAANATARRNLVERELNVWVSGVMPGRTAYDLRRQSGSLVLDQQGEIAARDWLGHRSADTTRRWYASRIRGLEPLRIG